MNPVVDAAGELFAKLPLDVTLLVLHMLQPVDLVRMSEASWSLRRLACLERLWRSLVEHSEVCMDESEMRELEAKEVKEEGRASVPPNQLYSKQSVNYMMVLGDGGVGKTATIIRYCSGHFVECYDPTIDDDYRTQVRVDDQTMLLNILDPSGPEEFSAMIDQWILGSEGFILLYSITSRASFDRLGSLHEQVCRVKDCDAFPGVVVGNKVDRIRVTAQPKELVDRAVGVGEGRGFAEKLGIPFIEASARTGVNVDEIFQTMVRVMALHRFKAESGDVGVKGKKKCILQ